MPFHHHRDTYNFLTSAPVPTVIRTMAVPTIVSMLVTSLYNMTDTFFVSQLNTQCTAAVGIAFALMAVIQATGFFFGHGSGNYISRELGAKRHDAARTMAGTGLAYSLLGGLVIALLGRLWLTEIAVSLGSTLTVLPYTEDYLSVLLFGAPFMTASLTLNNQIRFQGNASYAMIGIIAGTGLNVLLDPLLIFTFGLGIKGAAWATVISQAIGCFLLWYLAGRGSGIRADLRLFSVSPKLMKEIVFGGTPSLSRQGLAALSTVALNVTAAGFGDAAIAAMSIVGRFCFFIFAIIIGLGQGFQPLCGFCYGAGLYDRVRKGFLYCIRIGTIFLAFWAVVGMIFAENIIRLFRSDPSVILVGASALRWQMLTFVLLPTIGLTNMLLQTIRQPLRANLAAAARSGLFFIPLIWTMPRLFGLTGLTACQAVSDVLSFALCAPMAWIALKEMSWKNETGRKR